MDRRATAAATGLALVGLASGASASANPIALDGTRHKTASIRGTVSGVSGALPYEPVRAPVLSPTDCRAPECAGFTLKLTLPRGKRNGVLVANTGTVGTNLGITMRLVDTSGAVVASSSNAGMGITSTGLQHGEALRSGQLPAGAYKLFVFSVGGTATFTGRLRWS